MGVELQKTNDKDKMQLKNINIRVKEYTEGWVVEVQKKKWYGKKYWTHLISCNGFDDEPWYYESKKSAIKWAKRYFEWDLLVNN